MDRGELTRPKSEIWVKKILNINLVEVNLKGGKCGKSWAEVRLQEIKSVPNCYARSNILDLGGLSRVLKERVSVWISSVTHKPA
jgi:hypothetical protein